MPYKNKIQDRKWHREYMQKNRKSVTPVVTPKLDPPGGSKGDTLLRPPEFKPFPNHLSKEFQAR